MEDEKIIDLFFGRSEQAIQEMDGKYGRLCFSLSNNILNNRSDAEECVSDAYLGAWNAIPPEKPAPLRAYLCKIVRNISLKRFHSNRAEKRNSQYDVALEELADCLASADAVEHSLETRELVCAIEGFLDALSEENRAIFMRRYWFSDPYAEIAARTGLSEKNVSVRLSRIRKQMRNYLSEREVLL